MADERPADETDLAGARAGDPNARPLMDAGVPSPGAAPLSSTDDSSALLAALRFADLTGTGAPDSGFPFKFGDFRIVREAGRGGMGIVYEAVQISLERRVALKILPPGLLSDSRAVARFQREAKITASLHHQNIVTVHAMGVEQGVPYYAMEYAAGLTLQQILKVTRGDETAALNSARTSTALFGRQNAQVQTPPASLNEIVSDTPQGPMLPASLVRFLCTDTPASAIDALDTDYYQWVARLFADVTAGLQEAHQHGIVHRDLKPSNLILDWNGRLRILDFGLAFVEGQPGWTGSEERLGTPLYMSPEQVRGDQDLYGPSTDVYSLGASLYEMLVFKPPFEGHTRDDIMDKILTRDPVAPRRLNRHIPRDLETVVLTCLHKDPRDRYVSAYNFGEDLRRLSRGAPVQARRRPIIEQVARRLWQARRLIAESTVALVLLIAVIALVWSYFLGQQRARQDAYNAAVRSAAMGVMRAQLVAVSENMGGVRSHQHKIAPAKDVPVVKSTYDGGVGDLFEIYTVEPGLGAIGPDPLEMAARDCARAQKLLPRRPAAYYQLANVLLAQGRRAEAKAQLKKAIDRDQRWPPSRSLLAALLEQEGNPDAAAEAAVVANISRTPGNEWVTSLFAVQRALLARDWRGAAEAYAKVKETTPEEEHYPGCVIEKLIGEAVALLNAGSIEPALRKFIQSDHYCRGAWPDVIEPALFLAKIYCLRDDFPSVATVLSDAFDKATLDKGAVAHAIAEVYRDAKRPDVALEWADRVRPGPARLCLQAELQAMLKAPEVARALLSQALSSSPEDVEILRAAGKVYVMLEDYVLAQRAFGDAARLAPGAGKPLIALAVCLDLAGKTNEASAELERAAGTDQRSRALQYLAGIRAREQDLAAAESYYLAAIEADPENAQALNNLGTLLDLQGRHFDAMVAYRRATRAAPTLAIARFNFGWALHRQRRFYEAAKEYRLAILFGMADAEAVHNNLGPCLQYLGERDTAQEEYLEALKLDRERDNYLANHSLGTLHEWREELRVAVPYLERAVEIEPRWVDAQNDLGFVYQQLESFDKALACYEKAFQLDPDFVWAHNNYAAIMLQEESLRRTRTDLEAAIVRLEDAFRLLSVDQAVGRLLADYRRLLEPRLGSYGSVDALIGDPETLVAEDAAWRFHRGREAPAPATVWTEPTYDDGAWEEGVPPFGYGPEADARTPLDDMRGAYTSLYLRRRFQVRDPNEFAALTLDVRIHGGLVVYINGKETGRLRAGAPGTALDHTATADDAEDKPWRRRQLPLDTTALRAGENVLALLALNDMFDSTGFCVFPVVQARTHRIDQRLRTLETRLEALRGAAQEPNDRLRALYFEGRLCEIRGQLAEARARYEEVLASDRSRPEPFVRLAVCLAATVGAAEAEAVLRQAFEIGPWKSIMLWEKWFHVAVVDARKSAADLVRGFPCPQQFLDGKLWGLPADLKWVATELANGRALRINCGGTAFRADDGKEWAGDRFYTGGNRAYLARLANWSAEYKEREFKDPALYHTERWFGEPAQIVPAYRISLPRALYEVRLHFIEGADMQGGTRAFSILLEDHVVKDDVRPDRDGYGAPRVETFTVRVDDGALDIAFGRSEGNPEVAGIEVESRGP